MRSNPIPHLALAGATVLFLAAPILAQDDAPKPEQKVTGKRIVIINGDEDHNGQFFEHRISDADLDCHEENGKKICISRMGPMHMMGMSGTFLGVELAEATPELIEHLGGPRDAGVLISRVEEGSPAAEAGIQVGDIVTGVDGVTVDSVHALRHAIASRDAGATVKIDLYRDGRQEQVSATLGKREPAHDVFKYFGPGMLDPQALADTVNKALEGINLEELDANVRKQLDAVQWDKIKETIQQALDQALAPHARENKP